MSEKCAKCQVYNPNCKKCYDRTRYVKNKKSILNRNVHWATNNKAAVARHQKRWRQNNQKSIKAWHTKNRKKINKYCKQRRKTLPNVRLHSNFSRNIHYAIGKSKKGMRWETIVGYSVYELMRHLESKFLPGMSWNNYGRGGWHIDHIIPKSRFNITDEKCEDFKKCWSLVNLQPLWEHDNCSKQDRYIG